MKLYDASLFALVIPTFDGTPFLKRTLDYLRYIDYQGLVVLSDNSIGEHQRFVATSAETYPDLQISAHVFPREISFATKISDSLERIESRFVMLHAHDDFIAMDNAEKCVEFLERNSEYSVSRGRIAGFSLHREAKDGSVGLAVRGYQMRAYEQADPVERVLDHLSRFASTFYSVHRRELIVEALRFTAKTTDNVIFFQYLSSAIAAAQGKIACLDECFYVRQAHNDSWSRSLMRDYEHWPLLITSPHFSKYYERFRSGMSEFLAARLRISEDVTSQLDFAAVKLFQRVFGGKDVENPGEASFSQKLNTAGSAENNVMLEAAQFAMRYPDTF